METSSINSIMAKFWKLCRKAQKAWEHNIHGDFELEQDLLPILNFVKENIQCKENFVQAFIEILRDYRKGPLEIVRYCMRDFQWEEIKMAAIKWMHESEDMRVKMAMRDLLEDYQPSPLGSHPYMDYTEVDRKDHIENWNYHKVMEKFKEKTKKAQNKAKNFEKPHDHEVEFLEVLSLIKNCIHQRPMFIENFILFMKSGEESLVEIVAFCMRDLQWEEIKLAAKKILKESKYPKIKASMKDLLAVYESEWDKSKFYTFYEE